MEYYRSLDNDDKERLLFWIHKELNSARARLWLNEVKYGHERASKVVKNEGSKW